MKKKTIFLLAVFLIFAALLSGAWTYTEVLPDFWVWLADEGDWDPYDCNFFEDCRWMTTVCNEYGRNEEVGIYFDPATAPSDTVYNNAWWPAVPCPTLQELGTCEMVGMDRYSWQGPDNPIYATAFGELSYIKFVHAGTSDVKAQIPLEPGTLVKNLDGTHTGQFVNWFMVEPGDYVVTCGGTLGDEAGNQQPHTVLDHFELP